MLTLKTMGGSEATMSSREIAELTGSSHDNVMKTIRRLAEQGVVLANETPYRHPQNLQTYPEFLLSFRDVMVVITGYSAELRARVIDRWQELEVQAMRQVPQSFAAALRLAAEQQELIEDQAAQLAAAAPAVEFVQKYADSTGLKGFRQVCKLLGANEHLFREFLIEEKIMYRLAGELTPHSQHIDAGRFCVKAGTAQNSGHAFNSARFTPKGVTWVAGEWAKWQLKQRQREVAHAA